MAPLTYLIVSLERSGLSRRSSSSSLSLGVTVGIGAGIALVCSLALVAFVYLYCIRRKRRMSPRARRETWSAVDSGMYGTKTRVPRKGLGRVLSIFSPKRSQPRGKSQTQSLHDDTPQDDARSRQLPDKEYTDLREPAVELEGGLVEGRRAAFGAEVTRGQLSPFEDAHQQVDSHGPTTPYNPVLKSEQDVSSVGHYRSEDNPAAASRRSLDMRNMVITADAPPAAWHRKRIGPPPPLTIEPPEMHARSPSDAHSAYSTWNTGRSAYTYSSINVPEVPSLPSHITNFDSQSLRSSDSNRSSHPLQYPPSPQTPGSTPSMSRSDSGAQQSFPLAPPTPTYAQPQTRTPSPRIPADANFECLGPLPANIWVPSPPHFRTTHQQQQDPFLTPRIRTPEDGSPVVDPAASTTTTTTTIEGETIQVGFVQDPLLHATNPFRPHNYSISARDDGEELKASTTTSSSFANFRSSRPRRDSTDSLGSNFTVEEEARIQAQIVKNLDALDKERVMGENDIVHIPQISARRYSWEEERR